MISDSLNFPGDEPAFEAQEQTNFVRRLFLSDFRSYHTLDLSLDAQMIALTGENGVGKTNILEALSLLTQGRGLRRADMGELARENGSGGWVLSVELEAEFGRVQLGTGLEPGDMGTAPTRKYRIDRAPVSSARAFADHIRLVWLTPSMDGLFSGAAGERRRFLDRLVLALDAEHGTRVNALEKALRNRNRLLEENVRDEYWLKSAEREVAELAIAVSAARLETVSRLAALINQQKERASPFPWADIHLEGELETLIATRPALEAEDIYRDMLRANRGRDAAAGRTLIGPQASDLVVRHGPKDADASRSSTGEQKALLVGLVLAHARLVKAMSGMAPLILLDEIAAHFDSARRAALYEDLSGIGCQIWMTGADKSAFAEAGTAVHILDVRSGSVAPAVSS